MSDIALYNTLRKIPEVSDDEAREAVADIASSKEVATKADLKVEIGRIETMITEIKEVLTWRMVIVLGIYTAIVSLIVKIF